MNSTTKDLIMQQLNAFRGWLRASKDLADSAAEIACTKNDQREYEINDAMRKEYIEVINMFSLVKSNIFILMEEDKNE